MHKHGPALQLAVVICLAGVLSAVGTTTAAALSFGTSPSITTWTDGPPTSPPPT